MATITVSVEDLPKVLQRDMKARERRVGTAITKTARAGVAIVRPRVPVAFGEVAESLHATRRQLVADAPHAAPVETGSRPHYPPLAPLIAWVKLRGMQALYGIHGQKYGRAHSYEQAMKVGLALQGEQKTTMPGRRRMGQYSDVDAPTRIAREIQLSIGRNGTKPHYYMGGALPEIMTALDGFVRAAMPDAFGSVSAPSGAGESVGVDD